MSPVRSTFVAIALLCFAPAASYAEVVTQQTAFWTTPSGSPRPLFFDNQWLIAFYDERTNLQLLPLDHEATVPVSTTALPQVSNSYIGFSRLENHLYFVWREKVAAGRSTGQKSVLFRMSSDGGKSFSQPVKVSQGGGAFHPLPLGQGGDGRLYLAWADERTSPRNGIFFNRSLDNGATWLEQELRLDSLITPAQGKGSANPAKLAYDPTLATRGEHVWVGWLEAITSNDHRFKFRSSTDAGTTWSEEKVIPTGEKRIYEPKLIDTGEDLMIFYHSSKLGVVSIRSVDGDENWSTPASLPGTQGLSDAVLNVTHNHRGGICVAWVTNRDPAKIGPEGKRPQTDVLASCSKDFGHSWPTAPARLDTDKPRLSKSLDPTIVMDDQGRAAVIWRDKRDFRYDIYANYSLDGGATWLASDLRINQKPGQRISTRPMMATDNQGNFLMTWLEATSDQIEPTYQLAYEMLTLPKSSSEPARFAFQDRNAIAANESMAATPEQQAARRQRLLERANELWSSYVKGDLSSVYKKMDPFLRAQMSDLMFMTNSSVFTFTEYQIDEDKVSIDGNRANLQLKVKARVDKFRTPMGKIISVPEKERQMIDHWIWIDGDWYRLYQNAQGHNLLPF